MSMAHFVFHFNEQTLKLEHDYSAAKQRNDNYQGTGGGEKMSR